MIERAVQKGMICIVAISTCGLLATGALPDDVPYKNIFNKNEHVSQGPKQFVEGTDSIALTPWNQERPYVVASQQVTHFVSDPKCNSEDTARILQEHPELILVGLYRENEVYVDRSMVETVAECREISMEDAKHVMLRTVIYLLESK